MLSQLFAGDELLAAIATEGPQRISRTENATHPAVGKVQAALLIWDPGCLPAFGPDGRYGDETAEAVRRFKVEELGVTGTVIDDVGPRTVRRLDEIATVAEGVADLGFVMLAAPSAGNADLAAAFETVSARAWPACAR